MHVQWIVNQKVTKREMVRGRFAQLMQSSYGFKAGTTVRTSPVSYSKLNASTLERSYYPESGRKSDLAMIWIIHF